MDDLGRWLGRGKQFAERIVGAGVPRVCVGIFLSPIRAVADVGCSSRKGRQK